MVPFIENICMEISLSTEKQIPKHFRDDLDEWAILLTPANRYGDIAQW